MRNWNSYHAWLSAMVVVVVIAAVAASVSLPPSTTTAFAAGPQPPYWPRYSGARAVTLLDGTWAYGVLDRPAFFDSMDSSLTPSKLPTPNTTAVPSCMDVAPPGTLGTRGIAFYRRTFTATGPVRLQFQACGFYCRVWVNGHEIGDHLAGGYVAFTLDVPETNGDNNELFVLADNRFNHTTAPLATGGDFWAYGGLMRSVELHTLPAATTKTVFPWRAYVLPVSLSHVNITVVLTDANYSGSVSVSLAFDGAATASTHSIMASKGQLVLSDIAVPNPRMWSTTDPQLHVVDVEIDDAVVSERFGLRLFDVEESSARIRINGKVIKLHGKCFSFFLFCLVSLSFALLTLICYSLPLSLSLSLFLSPSLSLSLSLLSLSLSILYYIQLTFISSFFSLFHTFLYFFPFSVFLFPPVTTLLISLISPFLRLESSYPVARCRRVAHR